MWESGLARKVPRMLEFVGSEARLARGVCHNNKRVNGTR
jgi:hypothetical protein